MHLNPADIQTIGIGLAAFLSTLTALFIFLSAHKESLGRAMWMFVASVAVWSWFGFLYELVPSIDLAREMRVISVMGIVWISISSINFSLVYLKERMKVDWWSKTARLFGLVGSVSLTLVLTGDLFGGRLIVGDLVMSPDQVLAPHAGPLLAVVIAYYTLCIVISGIALAVRARVGTDRLDRQQAELIFLSIVLGLTFGGARFTSWYGVDYQPFVFLAACAVPLFVFASFYAIKRYKLLNMEIAAAELLIFALWTFTFFRLLLDPTSETATLDSGFFLGVLILGVFLLRSIIREIRTQKELARLTIDRVKSEFVTVAAHQLHSPVRAIRSTFDLLSAKGFESFSDEYRELIQKGSSATNSMMLIVDDLLDVARMSGGALNLVIEPGDVRNAVRAGGVLFEEAAKDKHIQLTFSLPQALLQTKFDHGKLALVIENLIDNAVKYTPSGGSISVRALRDGDKVLIKVTDSGIGISRQDRTQLFEKFFRGEAAVRMSPDGSGLGLFIAKNIIDAHGGTITIVPAEKGGTEVTVALPVVAV